MYVFGHILYLIHIAHYVIQDIPKMILGGELVNLEINIIYALYVISMLKKVDMHIIVLIVIYV
jgi:hypothetical protein